jgi:hypothetical protein
MEWVVTTKELRQLMRRNVRLCPRCLERYTKPCAAVLVEEDADGVGHIVLLRYGALLQRTVAYEAVRCCSGQKWIGHIIPAHSSPLLTGFCLPLVHSPTEWRGVVVPMHRTLLDGEFVSYLLRRYPALRGELLTESALRKVGCDLEAEVALWQLSGSE